MPACPASIFKKDSRQAGMTLCGNCYNALFNKNQKKKTGNKSLKDIITKTSFDFLG
jgi:hypothetical protein